MAHEDDWIKRKLGDLKYMGNRDANFATLHDVIEVLLKKINKLEQEVRELRNGGKKK